MRRVALVTGASRGIGRGIALELAREGWDVCVNYIQHQEAAESTVRDIQALGQNAVAMQADVADGEAVAKMVSQAAAELAPISLLVNNAGIAGQTQFQDISDEQWNRYLAVNLSGARNTIRAVLPHMLTEKSGCIINISSIWGLRGASCEVAYACTKAALIGLTRSLALELAPSQIRVNCVAPGVIETDMLEALGTRSRRCWWNRPPGTAGHAGGYRLRRRIPGFETGLFSSQDRYWEPRAGSLSEVTPRRKSADSVRAFYTFPGRGSVCIITRPIQIRLRPPSGISRMSASDRARFKENRYTIPTGSL